MITKEEITLTCTADKIVTTAASGCRSGGHDTDWLPRSIRAFEQPFSQLPSKLAKLQTLSIVIAIQMHQVAGDAAC